MIVSISAIYENGTFKPLEEIHISDGTKVKLTIESVNEKSIKDILSLVTGVYDGLSENDILDIEKIAFHRNDFFNPGKV